MSFSPDDYPETQPMEWYETYEGTIVGHISLLRDMLNPEFLINQNSQSIILKGYREFISLSAVGKMAFGLMESLEAVESCLA